MAFRYVKRSSKRAKRTKGVSYVPKGKKPRLGSGKRFAALENVLAKKGVRNPAAVAAYIGRKKYGTKKFQSLAIAGKRRKKRK